MSRKEQTASRALLAPLFPTTRHCADCAAALRKTGQVWWEYELEQLPPLGRFNGHEFIPDFPTLLMFDRFVISEQAKERILSLRHDGWLGSWPTLLEALEHEGRLEVDDFETTWSSLRTEVETSVTRDIGMPAAWERSMAYHDNLMFQAREALTPAPGSRQPVKWVFNPSAHPGVAGPDKEFHSLSLIVGGHFDDDAHRALAAEAHRTLESQLLEVNAMIAFSRRLGAATLAWAPYATYFREKLANDQATFARDSATKFFEVAFPNYRPESVKHFMGLHRDRRIRDLREEVVRACKTGDALDPRYPQRVLEEVIRLQRIAGKRRRIVSWIATVIGLVPDPIVAGSAAAANELASKAMDLQSQRQHRWFYLISDGTGHT